MEKTITLFGSARPRPGESAYDDVVRLGKALAHHGLTVCNGGYAGTMEAGARGARSAEGHTIGITCSLFDQPANEWIVDEILTETLEDRLKMLATTGEGFIVLPGGTGTLLELAYVLECMNKGFIDKRPVVLYGDFWVPVLEPLKKEMKDGRLGTIGGFLNVARTPEETIERLV